MSKTHVGRSLSAQQAPPTPTQTSRSRRRPRRRDRIPEEDLVLLQQTDVANEVSVADALVRDDRGGHVVEPDEWRGEVL